MLRTLCQVPNVFLSILKWGHPLNRTFYFVPNVSRIEGFHCSVLCDVIACDIVVQRSSNFTNIVEVT